MRSYLKLSTKLHVSLNITSTLLLTGLELEVTELKLKGWPD